MFTTNSPIILFFQETVLEMVINLAKDFGIIDDDDEFSDDESDI